MPRSTRSRRLLSGAVAGTLFLGGLTACGDDDDTDVDEELEDLGTTISTVADDVEDTATSVVDDLDDDDGE